MSRRPLAIALALLLLPVAGAHAEDLLQTYELARSSDPQLSAAESTRLANKEGEVQARSALLPQVNASASFQRSRLHSPGGGLVTGVDGVPAISNGETITSSSRNYGVNVDQMIYDRGNFTRLRSQNALSEAADYQLVAAGDSLTTRTSAAYFNVLVAIETLAAAQAQETALQKQFDFADKRLEVGLAPITDVYEARAQYDSARASTIVTRNQLEDAYQALVEITGQPVRNLKGLPEDFSPTLPAEQSADSWVESAVKNNPALVAQQFVVQSAEANVETARSGYWPRLYLNGGYGNNTSWNDNTAFGAGSNKSDGPSIGVTLSVPIFTGGFVSSQVRQAIATRDVNVDQLEQQKRALVRNTRNAYETLVAGISEVEARKSAVFSARSAYSASQVGLEVGTRTVLDVLNNQRTLFDAERAYALSRYNFLQNRLLLDQAAGSLGIADVQDINRLLTANAEDELVPGSEPGKR